jgi:hypothetical protein
VPEVRPRLGAPEPDGPGPHRDGLLLRREPVLGDAGR